MKCLWRGLINLMKKGFLYLGILTLAGLLVFACLHWADKRLEASSKQAAKANTRTPTSAVPGAKPDKAPPEPVVKLEDVKSPVINPALPQSPATRDVARRDALKKFQQAPRHP